MSTQTKNKSKTVELDNKLIIFDDSDMTQNDIILARWYKNLKKTAPGRGKMDLPMKNPPPYIVKNLAKKIENSAHGQLLPIGLTIPIIFFQ